MRQQPPPADFSHAARDLWSAAQRQLGLQGTWEKTDRPLLEMYVRNLMAARHARETADQYQQFGAASHEQRALLKQAQDAEAAAFALARVLLLTPEARKRHGIGKSSGEGELKALREVA